jgi:hypothetical protein
LAIKDETQIDMSDIDFDSTLSEKEKVKRRKIRIYIYHKIKED